MSRHFVMGVLMMSTAIMANENLAALIKEISPGHPRLFVPADETEALRAKIASQPLLGQTAAYVTETADAMLDLEPVERIKKGKRLLGVSRTCLKRVLYLSVAHRLTGEKSYAERARTEMLAAAGFTDWNPSHFLDVGEMTTALGIGYDWLYDTLAPEARDAIRKAIVDKGLKTSLRGGWWVKATNNWNQVCHGGLTVGALAVAEDEPELAAQIIRRAVENLPIAMAEYAPDGAYPEGPGYWNYGTGYNVIAIAALESVLGTDFGLSDSAGFLDSSTYYLHAAGPTGLLFNYSDCGSRGGVSPAMYWFAARREKPALLWRERRELEQFLSRKHNPGDGSYRLLPFLLVWVGALERTPMPEQNSWKGDGKTPVAMHRSGWTAEDEVFVGIKGGSPGASHAHMDIGSFVMDADGVRWAIDLGMQSYITLESKGVKLWGKNQDAQRWDVFRLSNFSHNTLVVDGRKQRVDGHAPILDFSDKAPMPHTVIDMTSVYQGQLAAVRRGIGLRQDRTVLVHDEIEALDRVTKVRWGMVTKAAVTIETGDRAILIQDDKRLTLRLLSPANAQFKLYETADPPREYDARNDGTCMIGFESEISPSAKQTLTVLLCPRDAICELSAVKALADW